MKVNIFHPSTRNNIITQFSQDYSTGVNSIAVKNTTGFTTTKMLILGNIGFQQSEILRPSAIPDINTFTLAANTKFPHYADQRITLIDYDQIKVYVSTTGVSGSYSLQNTINITIDQDMTVYEDTTSQPSYYYKYSYYNSNSNAESDLSDPIAATGFQFYALKTMIDRVLSLFGDANADFVTRGEVRDFLNERYEMAQKELAIATKRAQIQTATFQVQLNIAEYSNALPANFLMEKAVKVSSDGGVTFPYNALSSQVDSLGSVYQTNVKYRYYIYGSTFGLDVPPQNATDIIKIYYVPLPTTLSLQTDLLGAPFQNSSDMFVKGALASCYLKDRKTDEFKMLDDKYGGDLALFISFIKRMQNLHPQFTELMDNQFV